MTVKFRVFRNPIISNLDLIDLIVQACVDLHNYLLLTDNTRYFTFPLVSSIVMTIHLGTNSIRFHVEITIINFIYYYYLTIGGLGFVVWVWRLGFGGLSLRVLGVIGGLYVHTLV